jgi:hypothetical protein
MVTETPPRLNGSGADCARLYTREARAKNRNHCARRDLGAVMCEHIDHASAGNGGRHWNCELDFGE